MVNAKIVQQAPFQKIYASIINDDNSLTSLPLTAFGDLRTAELTPWIQFSFEYTVSNSELIVPITSGGGTLTQADAMAVANTSDTTSSIARFICRQHVRYRAGLGGLMRFTALFTTGVADTSQWAGLFGSTGSTADFENGYVIGFNGATFGIARFQNDTIFFTALSDCDDPLDGTGTSGHVFDATKLNVFAIQYQYLGAGAVRFFIEDGDGYFFQFHMIDYAGTSLVPSVYNPNFHIGIYANNKGTTADLTVKTGSMAYFIEGKSNIYEVQQYVQSSGRIQKTAVTTQVALFTIRNKSTYASKSNLISILLERLSLGVEANAVNNLGQFRLVKNATLGGTPSYSDINTNNSLVEIDVDGTTVTGGVEILSGDLAGKNDKVIESMRDYELMLHPGQTMTVTVQSVNSSTFNGSLMWKELF